MLANFKNSFTATLCLKKLHPFYFRNNFVDYGPIWIIFDRNVANEFYNLLTLTLLTYYCILLETSLSVADVADDFMFTL